MGNRALGLIAIIAIIAVAAFSIIYYSGLPLSIAGTSTSPCGYNSTMQCGQQVNGVVTSLSQVSLTSNFGPLNGQGWLIDFVLNGAGQYLFGTTTQQLASAVNPGSVPASSENINIQAKLNSQQLVYPYTYTGTDLSMERAVNATFNFSWFSQGAGFATICNQEVQNRTHQSYSVACTGPSSQTDFQAVFNGYNGDCTSAGGRTFSQGAAAVTIGGASFASGYVLSCMYAQSVSVASLYEPGSPKISENISVTYMNGTTNHTFYLTSQQPQSSYDNTLFAQIYGYNIGSLNTYIGTTAPSMLVTSSGGYLTNHVSVATAEQYDQISSGCYSTAGIQLSGVPYNFIYNPTSFLDCISQQNKNVNTLLGNNYLQTSNPFYVMKSSGFMFGQGVVHSFPETFTGSGYYGYLNLTSNPVLQAEVQMVAKVDSLGLSIPVSMPKMRGVSPDPVVFRSGSQTAAAFSVYNNASVAGSAYIVVYSSNSTVVGQSANFNVAAGATVVESVSFTGYNPNQANLDSIWHATVYSSQMTSQSSTVSFNVTIQPNCAAGSVYVNNTNCVNEGKTCQDGYYWNGNTCQVLCSPPSMFNASTQSCWVPIQQQPGGVPLWEILVPIIAVVAVAAVVGLVLKGKSRRPRRVRKR